MWRRLDYKNMWLLPRLCQDSCLCTVEYCWLPLTYILTNSRYLRGHPYTKRTFLKVTTVNMYDTLFSQRDFFLWALYVLNLWPACWVARETVTFQRQTINVNATGCAPGYLIFIYNRKLSSFVSALFSVPWELAEFPALSNCALFVCIYLILFSFHPFAAFDFEITSITVVRLSKLIYQHSHHTVQYTWDTLSSTVWVTHSMHAI